MNRATRHRLPRNRHLAILPLACAGALAVGAARGASTPDLEEVWRRETGG